MKSVVLNNGMQLPTLCYGSAIVDKYMYGKIDFLHKAKYFVRNIVKDRPQLRKDIALPKMINFAMKNGCNMFDTSRAYAGSENIIGNVLKKYNRSEFYVVTKLCNSDQYKGNIRGALEKSLSALKLDYVDVYLMHWPVDECYLDSWHEMEKLYDEGLCKAIGVCNCNIHHLQAIIQNSNIIPMINQIECHPLFTQTELRKYCLDNKIQIMAYTSTARMDERLYKTVLVPLANKYGKKVPQIILRWHQQIGNIPIVNSSSLAHLADNISIGDFSLTEDEISAINKININSRLRYDPDNCDFRQL